MSRPPLSNKIIVIIGPTSSGKTKLAIKLAKKFNGEIISADSRQVYKGMEITSGQDLSGYGKITHYLIGIADVKKSFDLARYQKMANKAIKNILERGKTPFLVGGSGFYVSAIVDGLVLPKTKLSKKERSVLRQKLEKLSLTELLSKLKKVDIATYKIIDKNNRRRVQRALEIYYETGTPKSQQFVKSVSPYDFLLLGIKIDKEKLHKAIEKSINKRLKEGMINEIKKLRRNGVSWKRLGELGLECRQVARYLQGEIAKEEMKNEMIKATKDFAKRQMTWFKRDPRIVWVNNDSAAEELTKKFLQK